MDLNAFIKCYAKIIGHAADGVSPLYELSAWSMNDGKPRHLRLLTVAERKDARTMKTIHEVMDITLYFARFLKCRRLGNGFLLTGNYGGGYAQGLMEDFEELCKKSGITLKVDHRSV